MIFKCFCFVECVSSSVEEPERGMEVLEYILLYGHNRVLGVFCSRLSCMVWFMWSAVSRQKHYPLLVRIKLYELLFGI